MDLQTEGSEYKSKDGKGTIEVTGPKGTLSVMDKSGDSKYMWDKHNADEVQAARDTFDKLRKKGYLAFKVTKSGDKGEQINTFDPEAEKIIMSPPLAGG